MKSTRKDIMWVWVRLMKILDVPVIFFTNFAKLRLPFIVSNFVDNAMNKIDKVAS
jgi:hypothetical protein